MADEDTEDKKLWLNIVSIITILVLLCVTFVAIKTNSTKSVREIQSESTNIEQNNKQNIEIKEHHICQDEFGNKAVCGLIQNNTDKQYSYVQVDIDFYDDKGVQIGNSSNNSNKIEPHGMQQFRILINEDNVSTYKIKSVEGYILS